MVVDMSHIDEFEGSAMDLLAAKVAASFRDETTERLPRSQIWPRRAAA